MSPDTAKTVASYGQHVINSQRIEIKPRSFKEMRTEPYFPWQRQENNKEMPWQKYNTLHEKLAAKNIQMGPYESYTTRKPQGRKGKGPHPSKIGRAKDSEGQEIVPIQLQEYQSYLTEHQCVGVSTIADSLLISHKVASIWSSHYEHLIVIKFVKLLLELSHDQICHVNFLAMLILHAM